LVAIANMTKSSSVSQAGNHRKHLWLAALMAVLSLFVHGYLYMQHLALQSGQYTKSICDINEKFDCSAVAASAYAEALHVPVALWGFMANLAFLILVGVYLLTDENKKPGARRNLLIAAVGIFAGSLVMGTISTFLLAKFCAFCMSAYVLSILLLIFTWLFVRGSTGSLTIGDFKPLSIVAVICFVGAFIVNSAVTQGGDMNSPENQAALNGFINDWKAAPAKEFKAVDPLVKGPADAKMTIVEFADYRCIHCKHAAPILHAFLGSHPDVRLEFQPWPLDGECNSALNQANGASCLLARASWCAEKNKHSGWSVHDYIYGLPEIYASVDTVRADLGNIASAAGMSIDEMKACADSDAAKAAVRAQADVGATLNLEGTPTIYVNKKQLPGGQSLPILKKAYESL